MLSSLFDYKTLWKSLKKRVCIGIVSGSSGIIQDSAQDSTNTRNQMYTPEMCPTFKMHPLSNAKSISFSFFGN